MNFHLMTENFQYCLIFFYFTFWQYISNKKAKLNHKMGYKTTLGYWNFPKLKLHATSLKEITCTIESL
jgi:hypothetical protein